MALERGTRLGPYQIESPIGAGGMGEVYKDDNDDDNDAGNAHRGRAGAVDGGRRAGAGASLTQIVLVLSSRNSRRGCRRDK